MTKVCPTSHLRSAAWLSLIIRLSRVYNDVLLAEAQNKREVLRVNGLTIKDLKQKFEVDLALPNQVLTGSFYVGARIVGDEIIVQWRSIQRPVTPIPTREPAHVTVGFARIDPATGRLIAAGEGEPSIPPTSRSEIPDTVQKLADEGALASPLCRVDGLVVALQYAEQNGERRITLRRWNKDTGEGMPPSIYLAVNLLFEASRGIADICWPAGHRMVGSGTSIRQSQESK
jgi:hypothetical protein